MNQIISKTPSPAFKDFRAFSYESKKSILRAKVIFCRYSLSPSYVHAVLLSLYGHGKLARSQRKNFWCFDGFLYRNLFDIFDNPFIAKIVECKAIYESFGYQLTKFDPLFENIIFLPLAQQRIVLQKVIIQHFINTRLPSKQIFKINGFVPFEQFFHLRTTFESAALTLLFDQYDWTTKLLKASRKVSNTHRTLQLRSLFEFISYPIN